MGISAKAKNSGEGWGLGLLLVFFPDDDNDDRKKKLTCPSSSSPSPSPSSASFKSSNSRCSGNTLLLNRAQSTISICALIVFFTLLLFTLCTFEPTSATPDSLSPPKNAFSRKWLAEDSKDSKIKTRSSASSTSSWFAKIWGSGVLNRRSNNGDYRSHSASSSALQGMGTLFRRGTRAMSDLVVAHLMEDTTGDELRLFLRTLHRSGVTARSDVVLIFPSPVSSKFSSIIGEENESFLKLVSHYRGNNNSVSESVIGFDVTQFMKLGKKKEKQSGEPIWGRKTHSNYSNTEGNGGEDEFAELSWGSLVGFEAAELDPEDSLAGFLEHVPMSLRRWACYPMLLGRVRRNFKHLMLVDVKKVVLLGDALARVRNLKSESVYLWTTTTTTKETQHGKHSRKKSEKTRSHNQKDSKLVNPAVIMGGNRGVRRLSNAMLTEIVRATIQQHKSKASITESGLLNQLVHNDLLLKNIEMITATESIPDSGSLASRNKKSSPEYYSIVHRGNSNLNLNSFLIKEICSSVVDSSVYKDCSQDIQI